MNRNSWKKQGNWRRSRKEIKSISWIERGTIEKNNFINSQISAKIKVNCIIKYFYKIINKSAKVNSYRKFHFLVHFPLQRDCKQYCSAVLSTFHWNHQPSVESRIWDNNSVEHLRTFWGYFLIEFGCTVL